MKSIFSSIFLLFIFFDSTANNLQIQNVAYDAGANTLNFDVSWENGYVQTGLGFTRAYIFIKYRNSNDPNWHHLYLNNTSISNYAPSYCISASEINLLTSGNYIGIGVGPSCPNIPSTFSGFTNITLDLNGLATLVNPSFKVFGIEIVQLDVSSNDYYVGDGVSENRFHKGSDPSAPYYYDNPGSYVSVGNSPEDINTTSSTPFPVSSIPFWYFRPQKYIMRYEITQQQYVDFLNCLSREAQNQRTWTDISGTSITNRYVMSNSSTVSNRNGVKCEATLPPGGPITFYCDLDGDDIPNENNDGQNISANYLSPADLMAYLDWAGFQPMNEAQYEFYCRGSDIPPVPGEYAWGNTMKTAATLNIGVSGGPNETPTNTGSEGLFRRSMDPMRTGAAATSSTTRSQAGASYFGIMDLSGNVAEMVIGSYTTADFEVYDYNELEAGDGVLDIFGNDNQTWPDHLVTKGFASSNSSLNTTSHRHPGSNPYILHNDRKSYAGGRGIFD